MVAGVMSESVNEALRWAAASAVLRGSPAAMSECDLVFGVLLAHPDPDGELRRLITHFDLTGRDVLPDDYPEVTPERLGRAVDAAGSGTAPSQEMAVNEILAVAGTLSVSGTTRLIHVVGALLIESAEFQQWLQRALLPSGVQVTRLAQEYRTFLPSINFSSPVVAGKQLGDWLVMAFPRESASLATYSSDQVDPEADFVGVSIEADAFAYLLASKALVPPLAVGLFGNWGTGKSFLMAKIRKRIKDLTALRADPATAAEIQVWQNIKHVEFNAWEYVETNLFAALIHRIFAELTPESRRKLSADRTSELTEEITAKEEVVAAATKTLDAARKAEATQASKLRRLQLALADVAAEVAQNRDALIAQGLEQDARSTAVHQLRVAGEESLGPAAGPLEAAIRDANRANAAMRRGPWLSRRFWTVRRTAWITLAIVVAVVASYLVDRLNPASAGTGLLAGLVVLVPAAARIMNLAAAAAEEQQRQFQAKADEVDEQLGNALKSARNSVKAAQEVLEIKRANVDNAEGAKAEASKQKAALEEERAALTAGSALADFVADRNASADYRSQLGQITKVNEDLRRLTKLTRCYNLSGAVGNGPDDPANRIILYIDDLDRCPPRKVVEVLEAVHLLLAFELFVVVVAVDTRWLTSSLHDGLPSLRTRARRSSDSPTALDYIEKIFQIPFWVEELDDEARARLVRGLLLRSVTTGRDVDRRGGSVVSVGDSEKELVESMLTTYGIGLALNAANLSITKDELAFIESLAPLVGGTPRRVKRFVNICKLLLAMAPPLSDQGSMPTERMATCFIAAVHEGMPLLAEQLVRPRLDPVPPSTLRLALDELDPVEFADRRKCIDAWLAKRRAVQPAPNLFDDVDLKRFVIRYDVVRRLRFESAPPTVSDGDRAALASEPNSSGLRARA